MVNAKQTQEHAVQDTLNIILHVHHQLILHIYAKSVLQIHQFQPYPVLPFTLEDSATKEAIVLQDSPEILQVVLQA
jgi:hypothetical protein